MNRKCYGFYEWCPSSKEWQKKIIFFSYCSRSSRDKERKKYSHKFLFDKAPHAPLRAMMFDFQTLRYASPMADLALFMAISTGTDVRSTHFSFIFKTYHEELIKTLMAIEGKLRSEIPEIYRYVHEMKLSFIAAMTSNWNGKWHLVMLNLYFSSYFLFTWYSYDNFLREYARLSLFGYITASSFLQVMHDPEEGVDFENMDRSLGIEFFVQKAFKQGGETVNYELAGLIYDMYKLHQKLNIDLEWKLNEYQLHADSKIIINCLRPIKCNWVKCSIWIKPSKKTNKLKKKISLNDSPSII